MFFIVEKIFKNQINKLISQASRNEREKILEEDRVRRIECFKIDFPLGQKVIYRSNEPGPLLIGHIVDHQIVGQAQRSILAIVKCQETGKEWMPMGKPIQWTKEREEALKRLQWWEQWNVLTHSSAAPHFTKDDAKKKEYKQKQ